MKIEKIGVIGAGQMGSGIAHVCALAGYDVVIEDINADALGKAQAHDRTQSQSSGGARAHHARPTPMRRCSASVSPAIST